MRGLTEILRVNAEALRKGLGFGRALQLLEEGAVDFARRRCWHPDVMIVRCDGVATGFDFISRSGERSTYDPTRFDMNATDWETS